MQYTTVQELHLLYLMKGQKACIYCKILNFQGSISRAFDPSIMTLLYTYQFFYVKALVALSDSRIKRVVCFGSDTMDESLHQPYGNPYPVESALFEFENGLKAEATRSFSKLHVFIRNAYLFTAVMLP